MKHLRLLLTVTLVATLASFSLVRADSYDSDEATIQKKNDTTAKVMLDKKTYIVPITFGDGASWDNVKDHYELSDASAACVKSCKKVKLSVAADGTASWSK